MPDNDKMIDTPEQSIGKCRNCGDMIAFLTSQRTGKKYVVNCDPNDFNDFEGTYRVDKTNWHSKTCKGKQQ
jgi:hypothetical protein